MARKFSLAILLGLSAVLSVSCGGGGGDGFGPDSCSDTPRINSTPTTTATVGQQYGYVVDWYHCLLCTTILPVRLPPGAIVIGSGIYWTPSANDINRDVSFAISTPSNACGDSATQSWTVTVHPAPVIVSFTAASSNIRRGESATLTAVFQGSGRIDGLGPVTSNVPIITPPLNVSSIFTLFVSNNVGFELNQSISIQVPSPPAILSLSASPTPIAAGATSTLSWTTSGDFTVARLNPLGTDVRGIRSIAVTPAATTTYTLFLSDDVGASANASVQVEVVPMPAIESFVATPASSVLGGTVSLTARFTGTGRIDPLSDGPPNSSLGAVNSGEPITSPPLRRYSGFRLVVEDIFGRLVSQDLFVDITGPGTFRATSGSPLVPRRRHSATRLADGRVFIAGGLFTDSTEIYDPVTDTFTAGPLLLEPRQLHSAVLLRDGRVLLLGGVTSPTGTDEIYEPSSGIMTATSWSSTGGTAVRLPDDRVFIGGNGIGYIIDASATSRGPLIQSGVLNTGCLDSVARLADGRVLDVFGYPAPSPIFSPATDSFALTGAVARNRGCGFKATLTGDGRVLVTGGNIFPGVSAEIYDPTTGLFSDVGPQQTFTSFGTGSTLSNGKVLLIGGSFSPWAEIFDPSTQTFTATGGMRVGRSEYTATVLLDGRVLVVGGCQQLPCDGELYTPP